MPKAKQNVSCSEKANSWLTDEEVEAEIKLLEGSPHVRLARKELRLKYKRRQRLYSLRNLEKRGKHLAAEGITIETIDEYLQQEEGEEL